MNYNIIEDKNKVILEGVSDFEPVHIFECGQCFRWNKEDDGSFTGVALDRILNVKKEEDKIIFSNTNIDDFNYIWYDYFDLDRDYGKIKKELSKDDAVLDEAVKFGSGIRILNQEPFETTISFIISANNRIPRIKKSIELISERYGSFLGEYNGKKYYSFPQKEELSKVTVEELEDCKVGFRAKYIIAASKAIANGEIDIYNLKNLSTEEAREILMTLKGCLLYTSPSPRD